MPRRRRQNGLTSYEVGVKVVTLESSGVEIIDPLHDELKNIVTRGLRQQVCRRLRKAPVVYPSRGDIDREVVVFANPTSVPCPT